AQTALQPHLAAYRLVLGSQAGGSALLEVRGGLVIEWQRECEGWTSRQRLGFVAATEDGGTISHDVRFTSWEASDGSLLRYVVRSFENDELQEEYRGIAELAPDEGGVADFTEPHEAAVALPPGTVFPTEHMQLVLQAAEAGKRFVSHEVFDGFGFDSLTQVTSVIGAPRPLEPLPGHAPDVGSKSAWPVSMAYYNVERGEAGPDFQATFLLDAKGILYDVNLDYGDFRLAASLEQLELLDRPDC
ncbi:MAG: EipB family protein, partial [Geminicoccaceae bacterium]